jgi:hypothetical protein
VLRITSIVSTYSDFVTPFPNNVIGLVGGYIVINGTGFLGTEQVFFRSIGSKGATLASSIIYASSTQLKCTLPASTAGSKMLFVVNLSGKTVLSTITYQFSL